MYREYSKYNKIYLYTANQEQFAFSALFAAELMFFYSIFAIKLLLRCLLKIKTSINI